jgi:hypothetical protein
MRFFTIFFLFTTAFGTASPLSSQHLRHSTDIYRAVTDISDMENVSRPASPSANGDTSNRSTVNLPEIEIQMPSQTSLSASSVADTDEAELRARFDKSPKSTPNLLGDRQGILKTPSSGKSTPRERSPTRVAFNDFKNIVEIDSNNRGLTPPKPHRNNGISRPVKVASGRSCCSVM